MASNENHLSVIHYDSDSGADSDVPGTLMQHRKMNNDHARSLAHRLGHAPLARQERDQSYRQDLESQSKFTTTFDATDSASVTTTMQGSHASSGKETFHQNRINYAASTTNERLPSFSSSSNDVSYHSNYPILSNGATSELTPYATTRGANPDFPVSRTGYSVMTSGTESKPALSTSNRSQQHKRSKSDSGAEILRQANVYKVETPIRDEEYCMVFCEEVSRKLLCMLCHKVFKDPVIASCGHTFCHKCIVGNAATTCPADGTQLIVVVANLAVSEQIGELYIHCKYGCTPSSSGVPGAYEINPNGCPVTLKICSRKEHEATCQYAPVQCPNSSLCPSLVEMELQAHLQHCQHARCPHAKFNCKFEGTSEELAEHLRECRFEGVKDFLNHTEKQMEELRSVIVKKDQEFDYMRGMFSQLTERLERLEKVVEVRIDLLDENLTKLSSDFTETRRCLGHIEKEISSMDSRQFNLGAFDVQSVLKCKGTFVGHQGPVWSLCVYSSLLFSGSSDNSIKVWDTRSNYKCINTFAEHSGMILALCAYRGKLYSGSADCTISVFDIETQKMIQNFTADDNPICTLAVGNGMLFSGSLKSIKVWELDSLKMLRVLGGMNHWIRALLTTENYLYCGSYQTIKIYDLKTLEQLRVIQTQGGSVYSLVVSREYIVCGTYENSIHVWDVKTYKTVAKLTGHCGTVYDLVLMTLVDTNRVISASYDGSLRVWSLDNMQCVQTLFRHQGSVTSLAVSRGRLFSGAVDSTVKVWS